MQRQTARSQETVIWKERPLLDSVVRGLCPPLCSKLSKHCWSRRKRLSGEQREPSADDSSTESPATRTKKRHHPACAAHGEEGRRTLDVSVRSPAAWQPLCCVWEEWENTYSEKAEAIVAFNSTFFHFLFPQLFRFHCAEGVASLSLFQRLQWASNLCKQQEEELVDMPLPAACLSAGVIFPFRNLSTAHTKQTKTLSEEVRWLFSWHAAVRSLIGNKRVSLPTASAQSSAAGVCRLTWPDTTMAGSSCAVDMLAAAVTAPTDGGFWFFFHFFPNIPLWNSLWLAGVRLTRSRLWEPLLPTHPLL